ncbi:MAG: chorismate lyase [Moraxella sp.]|nr:chorismate lyase [Moraxella sp.]
MPKEILPSTVLSDAAIPTKTALALKEWLVSQGSLTARLEALIGGQLGVWVVHEGYRPLFWNEKKQLGLSVNHPMMAWLRTVYLYDKAQAFCPTTALVRATSIFPVISLVGDGKRLKQLHTTPIGYVLFKKNRTLPHTRTFVQMAESAHYYRQTVYDWYGRTILIEEEFLPALVARLA